MDPVVTCPRCRTAMSQRIAEPRPGAQKVRADICDSCQSMWFDEPELKEVSPALGKLPLQRGDEAAQGPASSLPHCPRCQSPGGEPMRVVPVLDIQVDFCSSCRGVWLDGGELMAILRATAESSEPKTGDDRCAPRAAQALASGQFACARCEDQAPTGAGLVTAGGLVCSSCFYGFEEGEMKKSKDYGDLTRAMRHDRFGRAEDAREEGQVGAAMKLFGFLASGAHCSRCGHLRGDSRCVHS